MQVLSLPAVHDAGIGHYWKVRPLENHSAYQISVIAKNNGINVGGQSKDALIAEIKRVQALASNNACLFFFRLPAELRNRVYEAYFANFKTHHGGLVNPAEPPITMANRQLRAESLPHFYNQTRFIIHMSPPQNLNTVTTLTLSTHPLSRKWLQHISQANLAMIKYLRVVMYELAIDLNFGRVAKADFLDDYAPHVQVPLVVEERMKQICVDLKGQRLKLDDVDRVRIAALSCYEDIERSYVEETSV